MGRVGEVYGRGEHNPDPNSTKRVLKCEICGKMNSRSKRIDVENPKVPDRKEVLQSYCCKFYWEMLEQ